MIGGQFDTGTNLTPMHWHNIYEDPEYWAHVLDFLHFHKYFALDFLFFGKQLLLLVFIFTFSLGLYF